MNNTLQVMPIDNAVAQQYGKIRAKLEQAGQTIGNNDLWIAAHAKTEGWILAAILPNMTASSASRMSHQPSSRIAGKCKVLADIVRRCPHPDIVGKIGIIGDVIDSAPVALLHDPEGSE